MAVPLITGSSLDTLGQRSLDFAKFEGDMAKARADTELKRIEMMQKAMADAANAAATGNAINSNERLGMRGLENQYDLGMAPYMGSTGNARIWGDVEKNRIEADRDIWGGGTGSNIVQPQGTGMSGYLNDNNMLMAIIRALMSARGQ